MAGVEHWFYHLTVSDLGEALVPLLEKSRQRGWKVEVVSPVPERLAGLDSLLWTYREDSWLPHGLAGQGHEARQPVLLSNAQSGQNGAQALVLLDGAEARSLDGIERVMIVFDGRDGVALETARSQWRTLKADGHGLAYWQQEGAGWARKA